MDAQEIFDRTIRHLHKQGKQGKAMVGSMSGPYTACRYRNSDGTTCAVGHFISDDDYVPSMEGPVSDLLSNFRTMPSIAPLVSHAELLQQLQRVHDCDEYWERPNGLRQEFVDIARMFDLSITTLNECFPEVGAA